MAVGSVDRPATAEEKLNIRLQLAKEMGKEFDENRERRVLGMPPVDGRPAIFVPESDARKRLALREDVAGQRELEREAEAAKAKDSSEENATLRAQLEALTAQIAELKGEEPALRRAEPPAPTAEAAPRPEGIPNETWTQRQLLDFHKAHGLPALPKGGWGMTKRALVDAILQGLDAAQPGSES